MIIPVSDVCIILQRVTVRVSQDDHVVRLVLDLVLLLTQAATLNVIGL